MYFGCDVRKMGVTMNGKDRKQANLEDSNADTKSACVDVKEDTSAVNIEP